MGTITDINKYRAKNVNPKLSGRKFRLYKLVIPVVLIASFVLPHLHHQSNNVEKEPATITATQFQSKYYLVRELEERGMNIDQKAMWTSYTVKYGDTLLDIAFKYTSDYGKAQKIVNDIIRKNNLSNTNIYEGQDLQIYDPNVINKIESQFNQMGIFVISPIDNQKAI